MSSVITTNGRTRMNELAGNEEALVIDRMILAYIADLDTSLAADPDQQMPDADDIVYTYEIPDDSKGYVDADQVVYSMMLGSDVGTFKFNWIGLIEAETNTVITVTQTAESSKYPTDLTTNTTGNMITRNVILSYQDAQNLTGITVAAETWQFDYQAEINTHINTIVDPAQEGTDPKHLTDSQAKIWQDHSGNADLHVTVAQKTNWNAHSANTANPHGVTKAQVGLGNLPNAKSNSINLNSSSTLATSAAVKAENDALLAHIKNKSNPHKIDQTVSLIGKRSTNGTWTLTGLDVGKPLIIGLYTTQDGEYAIAEYRVTSGSYIGHNNRSNGYCILKYSTSDNYSSSGSATLVPIAATVVMKVVFSTTNTWIYAYQ
jgi:hypothetical protein